MVGGSVNNLSTKSDHAQFASPSKASRVDVRPRAYKSIKTLGPPLVGGFVPAFVPEFVLVSPSGRRVVVKRLGGALWLEETGWREIPLGEGPVVAAATEEGLANGGMIHRWGEPKESQVRLAWWPYECPVELARWTDGGSLLGVYENDHSHASAHLEVASTPIAEGRPKEHPLDWDVRVPGEGTAAIAAGGRVVLALREGQVKVFAREGLRGKPQVLAEVQLKAPTYLVSIVHDQAVVLEAVITEARTYLPEIPLHSLALEGHWTTRATVVSLAPLGSHGAPFEIPFEVLQPPIEGTDRFYLAGRGLAAVSPRGVEWQWPSSQIIFATAFADGTLAVSAGSELRIIAPNGTLRQTLKLSGPGPITTPPAIAPDGSLYVATAEHLYVAR
jgi:hypothetical protein